MKNLDEIKDEVSFKYNCLSWDDLMVDVHSKAYEDPEKYYDEVAKRYAQSVAEDLRERIAEVAKVRTVATPVGDYHEVDKDLVRNVEIITP